MPTSMKIEGLDGVEMDRDHPGWSAVKSVSYGIVNHGVDRAQNQQQRSMRFEQIGVVRNGSDHLTPQLIKMVGEASKIPEIVIETNSGDALRRLMRRITIFNAVLRELRPSDAEMANEFLQIDGEKFKYEFAHPETGVLSTVTWNNVTERFEP